MTASDWSTPEPELIRRAGDRLASDGTDVLATVVAVEGSAYRRPGAKLLLGPDGEGIGAITAGCLDEELRRAAADVRATSQPELVTYDLTNDGDGVWGLGIGCNGVIDVLFEPLDADYRPIVEAVERDHDIAVCTVLSDERSSALTRGDRACYTPTDGTFELLGGTEPTDGEIDRTADAAAWPTDALLEHADTLASNGRSTTLELDGDDGQRVEIFVDGIAAPPTLLVCGSGPDVPPVVDLATRAGFRTTVVGFRGGFDLSERVPDAARTVTTAPAELREAVGIDERTYAVVMSHNFVDDRLAVGELLDSPAPYVGLMGPEKRFAEMREAFADEGREFAEDELDRLYTPIGLDLGDGSPYGIATSIVSELLAVANDREPRHLSERAGPIHDRADVIAPDTDDSTN